MLYGLQVNIVIDLPNKKLTKKISFILKDSEALHVSPFETGTEVKVYQHPKKHV